LFLVNSQIRRGRILVRLYTEALVTHQILINYIAHRIIVRTYLYLKNGNTN